MAKCSSQWRWNSKVALSHIIILDYLKATKSDLFFKYNLIYLFGSTRSSLLCWLSLVAASKGYSLDAMHGLLMAASLVGEHSL